MTFALQLDSESPLLLAYETVNADIDKPQPTIQAQLIAGWNCPECGFLLKAIAGPWSDQLHHKWWTYDHKASSSTSTYRDDKTSVRPPTPDAMPRYRGSFNGNGGYLRNFQHNKPLTLYDGYSRPYVSKCSLGVSMRVGITGGVSALPDITESAREKLIYAISRNQHTDQVVVIPEVTGQREPIMAMRRQAADSWRSASHYAYDQEQKQKAWKSLLPTLIKGVTA